MSEVSPEWIEALRAQPTPWISWLEQDEREEIAARLHERYAGRGPVFVPLTDATRQLSRAMLARLVPVAEVACGRARPSVVERTALLLVEREDPRHLIVAVHEEIPPFLWFPAGQDLASLEAALAPYRGPSAPREFDMARRARGFIGTEGILEMDRDALLDHLSMSPLAESLFWGSAHEHDPWPEDISQQDLARFAHGARAHMAQREGAVWSMSFRAIASRAVVTLEDHGGMFALQVRYDPAGHSALLGALAEQFQMSWPDDLPVDVAALLIGLYFEDSPKLIALIEQALDAGVEADVDALVFNLYALSCVRHGDVTFLELLDICSRHPHVEVRTAVADIAIRRGFDGVLAILAARERDAALRQQLLERL